MKKFILIYIFLISLILTSCNVGSGGDVYEDNDIPREVKSWVEQYRYINVAATFHHKDKIYIMYANPSKEVDFTTEITSIIEEDDRWLIVLHDIEGEGIEGEWHYPYSLASINNSNINKEIVFENESSGYVSTLFEVPQDLLLYVEPVFQNMYESFPDTNIILGKQEGNENTIEGIARVFEANVSYRVLDDKGKQIYKGFTTATSGGPDWGYFNIDISKFEDAYLVEVFTLSAKDGSVENLVSIHL